MQATAASGAASKGTLPIISKFHACYACPQFEADRNKGAESGQRSDTGTGKGSSPGAFGSSK